MSTGNTAANTAARLKGKAKVTIGKAIGSRRLQTEGKADQVKGIARQAMTKARQALKH